MNVKFQKQNIIERGNGKMKAEFRYDSRYQSEHKQHMQETIEFILGKRYGDTIGYIPLAKLLHYNIDDELEARKFKVMMGRIKNFLIDYGYVLKSIAGVGYYILKPKQISGYCYHTYIRRTEGLLCKSGRILSHVAQNELSEIRKEEYDNVCNLNLDVTNAIDITIENSEYFSKKNEYDSLED